MRIDIDVARLAYNPNDESFVKDITKDIPAFKMFYNERPEEALRVFAWVVLVYDLNSPTRKSIRDYYHRKAYCANLVGFNINKKEQKFKDSVEQMLLGQDKMVNMLVVSYVASFSSPEYTQLIGFIAMQHQLLMGIISGDIDDRMSKNMTLITNTISELTKMLYGSGERDELLEVRKALYQQAGEDLKKLRPESVVDMLEKDGKLPDEWSPYNEGYMPNKITYVGDDLSVVEDE